MADLEQIEKVYASQESEKYFLSCIMLDSSIIKLCDITSDWFYYAKNKSIFDIMKELSEDGKAIDSVNIIARIPDFIPHDYVYDINIGVLSSANWTDYQDNIKQSYIKRKLSRLADDIKYSLASQIAVPEIQSKFRKGFEELILSKEGEQFHEVALDIIDGISGEGEKICKYGYPTLDKLLGGIYEGQLIIIGARPSVGKTVFCLEILQNIVNQEIGSCIYSLEMTNRQIVRRLMCNRAQVNMQQIEDPKNREKLMDIYTNKINSGFNFGCYDNIYRFSDLEQSIKKEAVLNGAKVVFIDHIGLIRGQKGDNKNHRLGYISSTLKVLAKELKIGIVCLSQLNRQSAKFNMPPQLHDLRDSGNIEQDADNVIMLHREENDEGNYNDKDMDIFVRKARNSKQGALKMDINMEYMSIKERVFNTNQSYKGKSTQR